ncbi:MAG: NUDIX domain-containing protein [Patescibacteria group bacterium]
MSKIWVNVEGAIYKDGKWLMIERSKKESHASGTISMVGGTLEFTKDMQNSLEENLKREIMEEVGIEIEDDMGYVESKTFTTDSDQEVLDVVFLCKYKSGEAKVKSDEVANVFWLTTEEIMTHPNTPPWIKQSIELANKLLQ